MNSEQINETHSVDDSMNNASAEHHSSKLCLDVMAELWGKKFGNDPNVLKQIYENGLHKNGASPEELNDAWHKEMLSSYSKDFGVQKAEKVMERIQKLNDCL